MESVQNRLEPIVRRDFLADVPLIHKVAAITWRNAWVQAKDLRAPVTLRRRFRDSMRVRALLAVKAVRTNRERRAE